MTEQADYPWTHRFLQGRLRHALSREQKAIVENLIDEIRIVEGDEILINRGDLVHYSTMLIEGYMLRTIHEGGHRAIVGFQVPGDFVDLHAFALKRLDHDLMVIGGAKIGLVPHEALKRLQGEHPHLVRLFWFSTLLDSAIHREWISKSGQLRAAGRVAHLIAEIWYRLRMVGLGGEGGFQTPMTQSHLAEICGISTVHISRTLTDLRDGGVVDFRRGRITILDAEKLKAMGKFDPIYLYGEGGLAVGDELSES